MTDSLRSLLGHQNANAMACRSKSKVANRRDRTDDLKMVKMETPWPAEAKAKLPIAGIEPMTLRWTALVRLQSYALPTELD
jgi:hypothetical protein